MALTNPIAIEDRAIIDDELMESAQLTTTAIGRLLYDLFAAIIGFEASVAGVEPCNWDPSKTSGLNFYVRDGRIRTGKDTFVTVSAGSIALTGSQTNYVQINPASGLTSNTSGFTAGYLPLFVVVTGSASITSVTDKRPWTMLLKGGAVVAANLEDVLTAAIPSLSISLATIDPSTVDMTIQLKDAAGANLAAYFISEIWLSDTATGWETATGPDGTNTVTSGTLLETHTANKRWSVMSDATGKIVFRFNVDAGAGTWYAGALSHNDRPYRSSAITLS